MASTSKASTSDTGSKGAFDGIAPSASISASKRTQKPCYDVFINHRGPDVKHTLATALYSILSELSFMLKSGATIIPIFYHVDPGTDLRRVDKGKGMYVQAFKEHERKGRYSPQKLQEWKSALHVVSFYHGEIINTNEDEMRLRKNIVSRVLKEKNINVPLVVAKYPVGLKEIVEDFKANTLLSAHANQDVQIVGIWGMGGSGKTTLTKELYNEISSSMDRSSFVFNIRDAASKGLLHDKQKKLLNDLGIQGLSIDNIEEGMQILSRGLRSIKVLIILDDVDNVEQLDALLPTKDSIERGSLIIVTTRTFEIFKSWDISSIYKMRPLNLLYAKQLFCWHSFLNFCPLVGFEELVEKFLKMCNGLPLSLKVFGAQLNGESSKEYWESQLNEISRIVPNDIKQKLKISYYALNDEEKEMFSDTACFFIGEESSLAIEVWNGLGWSGQQNWERLLHKCLVELDDNNFITMHDHLRDVGRDIANKQSPYRLWIPHQIINIQKQKKKKIGIQGIIATTSQMEWRIKWGELASFPRIVENSDDADEFQVRCSDGELMVNTTGGIWFLAPKLVGLKYFVITGDYFNQLMGEVSRELVWLRWFEIEHRNLSWGLSLKKLRVLELHESYDHERKHHLEELWEESNAEVPVQLRQLLISHCYRFQGFPKSIGLLNHLKKIVIINCGNVRSLPDEFCFLRSLEHLVFRECYGLSSLPSNFGNLSNLRHLGFWHCFQLKGFPVSFKNLMLLEHLNLGYCEDLTFTSEDLNFLENISKLEYLNLSHCKRLEELPHHITNQTSLRMLDFSNTKLRVLPENIGQLSRLRDDDIRSVVDKLADLFWRFVFVDKS
ncbi:hypothetical protein SUGI_0560190 [Cryptomeria japonica]|nr:hypothetical protein SUGI_0560190 [Cryptomeria japonica]